MARNLNIQSLKFLAVVKPLKMILPSKTALERAVEAHPDSVGFFILGGKTAGENAQCRILVPAALWGRGFRPAAGLLSGVFENPKPAELHKIGA